MKNYNLLVIFNLLFCLNLSAKQDYESDTIKTSSGNLIITFIGHGTLYFEYNNTVIHIDPVSRYGNYSVFPKADIILVTHHHGDHYDKEAIKMVSKGESNVILTKTCAEMHDGKNKVLANGDNLKIGLIDILAVPAYNIENKRENGDPFHPKGEGNGYIITFSNVKVYIAGDTENIPEMAELENIDIAFLPMNLPYTMTPEMVVNAVKSFQPKILYPYHFGNSNTNDLLKLMENILDCEVRIRQMK
jgi:L-ascorbate metabolism protein UlaG (beta-lactamase superfamily)